LKYLYFAKSVDELVISFLCDYTTIWIIENSFLVSSKYLIGRQSHISFFEKSDFLIFCVYRCCF